MSTIYCDLPHERKIDGDISLNLPLNELVPGGLYICDIIYSVQLVIDLLNSIKIPEQIIISRCHSYSLGYVPPPVKYLNNKCGNISIYFAGWPVTEHH